MYLINVMCNIPSDVRTVVASIKVYSLEDKKRPGYSCFSNPYRATTASPSTATPASISPSQQQQQSHSSTVAPTTRVSSSSTGTMRQYDMCEEYIKRLLLLA